jgi:hypothetical protein
LASRASFANEDEVQRTILAPNRAAFKFVAGFSSTASSPT